MCRIAVLVVAGAVVGLWATASVGLGGSHRYLVSTLGTSGLNPAKQQIIRNGRVEGELPALAVNPSWAPNGSALGWIGAGVWIASATGQKPHRVAQSGGAARLGWAADGAALAWSTVAPGALWLARGDGRAPHRVVRSGVVTWEWAPHGHRLVVPIGGRELGIDGRTGRQVDITPPAATGQLYRSPHWSPTGSSILYERWEGSFDNPTPSRTLRIDLVVAPADGNSARTLVTAFQATVPSDYDPRKYPTIASNPILSRLEQGLGVEASWSPDGSKVAFATPVWNFNGPDHFGTDHTILRVVDVATTKQLGLHLNLGEEWQGNYRWSPDSRRLAVGLAHGADHGMRTVDTGAVITVGADGRGVRTITNGHEGFREGHDLIGWSPDGTLTTRVIDPSDELLETRDAPSAAKQVVYRADPGTIIGWVYEQPSP